MKHTHRPPLLHSSKFKRTKIIATVGPATSSYEAIYELIKNGANGLRLNFSHGTQEEHARYIGLIRKASRAYGKPVAIIQDLQGPKIRLGSFEGVIPVQRGQILVFKYKGDYVPGGPIPTQYDLSKKVRRGEHVYLYDGRVRTLVTSVHEGRVAVEVQNDGILTQRKGINLPDTDLGGDILTKKDRQDIVFGTLQDIDYVALSFIQRADDVHALRRILKYHNSSSKIISKIETKAAVHHIREIIDASDAVMVARGDLAIETEPESVPITQREIIRECMARNKISIVATQMLASMTDQPEPTRAEVSDVATAVILGTDCVMLSDETAVGKYPGEAVAMMKRIIKHTEVHSLLKNFPTATHRSMSENTTQEAIASAIISLATQVNATAIVAETRGGGTALAIASKRPVRPVIAVTSSQRVAQQLALLYGVKSFVRKDEKYQASKLTEWLKGSNVLASGDVIVTASGQHPGIVGTTDTIKVRVLA